MWRSKISTKLLLGLGLILSIFITSIFVILHCLRVENGNRTTAGRVAAVLEQANELSNGDSEVSITMRSV